MARDIICVVCVLRLFSQSIKALHISSLLAMAPKKQGTKRKAEEQGNKTQQRPLTFLDAKHEVLNDGPLGQISIDAAGTIRLFPRYVGVYSILWIATGKSDEASKIARDSKIAWDNAKNTPGPLLQLRLIEGQDQRAIAVNPIDIPALIASKLQRGKARRVLADASLKLCECMIQNGVPEPSAKKAIKEASKSLAKCPKGSFASVSCETHEEPRDFPDENGNEFFRVDVIVVRCLVGGCEQTARGHHQASLRRALARLTENCSCNARWHLSEDDHEFQ